MLTSWITHGAFERGDTGAMKLAYGFLAACRCQDLVTSPERLDRHGWELPLFLG